MKRFLADALPLQGGDALVLTGRGRLESSVGIAVASELAIIVSEDGNARGPILIKAGKAGGGNDGRLLGRGHGGKQQE